MFAIVGITQEEYDQNTNRYRAKQDAFRDKLQRLQRADEQYYLTSTYILKLAQNAEKLFSVAKPEEKRQLVNLVCQNLKLKGEKLVFELKTPFDTIAECSNSSLWLPGSDSNRRPIGYTYPDITIRRGLSHHHYSNEF